jgi:hypothetical protein
MREFVSHVVKSTNWMALQEVVVTEECICPLIIVNTFRLNSWAQVKLCVMESSNTSKIVDVDRSSHKAMDNIYASA